MKIKSGLKFEDSLLWHRNKPKKKKIILLILFPLIMSLFFSFMDGFNIYVILIVCGIYYIIMPISIYHSKRNLKKLFKDNCSEFEVIFENKGITETGKNYSTFLEWDYFNCFELRNNIIDLFKEENLSLTVADYMLQNSNDWDNLISLIKDNIKRK